MMRGWAWRENGEHGGVSGTQMCTLMQKGMLGPESGSRSLGEPEAGQAPFSADPRAHILGKPVLHETRELSLSNVRYNVTT